MPEYKNQHYVPRFYFRNFSNNKNEIGIFNLKSEKSYIGSIKGQCAKDYFYGKGNSIESYYSKIEMEIKPIINKLIINKDINCVSAKEEVDLRAFILTQYVRTDKTKNEYDNLVAYMGDKYIRAKIEEEVKNKGSDLKPELMDKYKLVDNLAHFRLGEYAYSRLPLLADLNGIILINQTDREFIFSDAPVVLHNTYFNKITDVGTKGLHSLGLQIFYPLSDKILYLLTDKDLYKYNTNENNIILIDKKCDIQSINSLQYLYCNQNIYYPSNAQKSYIKNFSKTLKRIRPINSIKTEIINFIERETIGKRYHTYRVNLNYKLKLSFMELNKFDNIKPGVRNQKLIDLANQFDLQMDEEVKIRRMQNENYK